ncbi:tRNA 5-methoxyuridine(34)/uridine 5-oxyacetic acid(34) synthase CmoB [Helicobacter trogontum]|uniref:tRNA 5-methoxyuridine(34)/uridine 5-oxyacetic acid(34) synthase CmoB n=1 Tax=Helicobacter trogontum TaxID=50960 RepID=UPI000CF0CF4C|nr:tRNA 5-methoxyuridine(34)/uridine 5-oxyacetic acid(34) synthase CmoB [Helicobacter trogontum]
MKSDLPNNYDSIYTSCKQGILVQDLCKKDSILSQWSEAELKSLKPYHEILYKLLTLQTKATYSISRLYNNDSMSHNPDNTPILEPKEDDTKEAFSLFFHKDVISHREIALLNDLILELKPWRKGPFCLHYTKDSKNMQFFIDSEWQSNKKMKLILKALDTIQYDLKDKTVLDVGCNNGYYMFDLALRGIKHITGIDPIAIFFLQFYFIYKLSNISHCNFRLLGVQDVSKLRAKYDLVLCLGVLYHRKEPLQTLKQLKSVLAPNGILLLETLILQDESPTCLCPYPAYAKMPNVFYIFSPQALQNLALHAGFKSCELLSYSYTDNTEQRSTDFIDKKSLGDYLTSTQTAEGYPPACRGIFMLS